MKLVRYAGKAIIMSEAVWQCLLRRFNVDRAVLDEAEGYYFIKAKCNICSLVDYECYGRCPFSPFDTPAVDGCNALMERMGLNTLVKIESQLMYWWKDDNKEARRKMRKVETRLHNARTITAQEARQLKDR